MSDPIQIVSRSLGDDLRALAAIGHNVANLSTPGYRAARALPAFDGAFAPGAASNIESRTANDPRDGALVQTARPLDLALRGRGFFVIERDGRELLVRSGAFRIDRDNRLVTASGDPVLGLTGPLIVPGDALPGDALRIGADGAILAEGRELDRLRIVAVADPAGLRPAGGGAYLYLGAHGDWTGRVIQGAIESANVDAAEETVRLIELTRHAESVQRVISIYDKAMGAGINQLGGE